MNGTKLEQAAREVVRQHSMECLSDKAITALQEALAEQEKPLYRKVLREMLDAHEQAEQEPVAFKVYRGEVCYKSKEDDQSYGMWCPVVPDYRAPFPEGTKFYAAPVQQVDLTDDEIWEIWLAQVVCAHRVKLFARAVIAAYKEKQK